MQARRALPQQAEIEVEDHVELVEEREAEVTELREQQSA